MTVEGGRAKFAGNITGSSTAKLQGAVRVDVDEGWVRQGELRVGASAHGSATFQSDTRGEGGEWRGSMRLDAGAERSVCRAVKRGPGLRIERAAVAGTC